MAELVRVNNLSYTYPGASEPILNGITFSIEEGDFLLLTGPSGAGKSTLLRCLNGLVPHFSGGKITGQVEVGGINVLSAGPQVMSRLVGFVFQDPESQMVLDTVEAEIAFGLENLAVPRDELTSLVNDTLDLLDLEDLRHRSLSNLSGGERQRVAIASALVLRPKLLVLDEPTSQLDPDAAREVLTHITRIRERLGLTVVLVEQRLERITRFASSLMYMEEGQVRAIGPIRETIERIPPEQQPPLTRLAEALHWQPTPLTSAEGRELAPIVSHRTSDRPSVSPGQNGAGDDKQAILDARGIDFSYGTREVLSGVDISLAAGEATALIGANGSGKSTLLKCLVGLLRPSTGVISLDGESIAHKAVAQICRQVAYLPQAPDDLLFSETVYQELEATLKNHDLQGENDQFDIATLLDELGLDSFKDAYPRDLSVGQRQRVALGAIMITRPRLLLLDEPTRGLDYAAKQSLTRLWSKWQEEGMGILLVTHDMELVARVANRVLLLEGGKVSESGPVSMMLGRSNLYTSQVARLVPESGFLTVHDALAEIDRRDAPGG